MADSNDFPDRSNRAIVKFASIAAGIVIALGLIWFVLHAAVRPGAGSDATTAGNAASTTPPDAVNGGGVAGTGGATS